MQNVVHFGATSKLFLAAFFASLVPFITELSQTGQLPTKEALLSFGLLTVLGLLRVAQQVVLDFKNPPVVVDEGMVDEMPGQATDVNPDLVVK